MTIVNKKVLALANLAIAVPKFRRFPPRSGNSAEKIELIDPRGQGTGVYVALLRLLR
jgi:hypothetical protein